jgi:hypothetical protein
VTRRPPMSGPQGSNRRVGSATLGLARSGAPTGGICRT